MKIALLTICDESFAEISLRTLPSMQRYAGRFGLDFLSMPRETNSRPASWSKITCIRKVLQSDFDYCFYVDADALFVRFDEDIRKHLNAKKDLYLCSHNPNNSEAYAPIQEHFNAGVMVWSRTEWSINFLDVLWQQTDLISHPWWDQAALLDQLGYHSVLGRGPDKPNSNHLKHVQQLPVDWNVIVGKTIASDPILRHFAGRPNATRLQELDCELAFQSVRELLPKYGRYVLSRQLNVMSYEGKCDKYWARAAGLQSSRLAKVWWHAVGFARAFAKLAMHWLNLRALRGYAL